MFKKIETFLSGLRPKIQAIHDITGAILKYLPEPQESEVSDLETIATEIDPNNERTV
jgi:hypothetical protein